MGGRCNISRYDRKVEFGIGCIIMQNACCTLCVFLEPVDLTELVREMHNVLSNHRCYWRANTGEYIKVAFLFR